MTRIHPDREVPYVLGVVGGVAAGKSTVAELLRKRGARVINADAVGHRVLERAEVKAALVDAFGDEIIGEDGTVDRPVLADAAFGEPQQVDKLNSIVHPPILEEIRWQVEEIRREDGAPMIVLDAALLLETDLHRELCESVLFVDAPREERKQRARERGMSEEQFQRRSRAQMPPEDKKKLCDFVVSNDGSVEDLDEQLEELWTRLIAGRTKRPS
jgi:dephospho-CoA kinase